MLILIAAVANNNIIGNDGKIPWNIPEEMALFTSITMGHPVIVGRKTFESIGHVLPGREMFVLSHSRSLPPNWGEGGDGGKLDEEKNPDVTLCSSPQDALDKTKKERTVFVIGGSDVYAQMMPFVDEMRISHLKKAFAGDCYFPEIHKHIWQVAKQQEFQDFIHTTYTRI